MLSKSTARQFFLLGTVVCAGVFFALTADSLKKIPKQTHAENLTESVVRGKHLFERNNCMGCHTILGEGAYYAPELTRVHERRGEAFIRAMLKDPEAMYPGQRKMTNYHLKDQEIDDLVAFFKWIGEMDLNGFPPKPDLVKTAVVTESTNGQAVAETKNRPKIFNQMCIACHTLNGQGGKIGPTLDDVGARRDRNFITSWLKDPQSIKPGAQMPKLPLTDNDIAELSAYLSELKNGVKK